ncbi:MAG: type II toxin-antitoxin system RelE/ParE family toxin [Akkermansiaceae bacterium]
MSDLDAIADYIALDNPVAASKVVLEVFEKVSMLEDFPEMFAHPHDLPDKRYRHMPVPPVRVFYRIEEDTVYIVYIMRSERHLTLVDLEERTK